MTHGQDWIPQREADIVNLARRWMTGLTNSAKQTAYGWDPAQCTETAALLNTRVAC